MLQYLVILLSKDSVSYCHYEAEFSGNNVFNSHNQTGTTENNLISKEDLKAGILFAMKENLNIQFVYPKKELSQDYKDIIHTIDHTDIRHISAKEDSDVFVCDSIEEFLQSEIKESDVIAIKCSKNELFSEKKFLKRRFAEIISRFDETKRRFILPKRINLIIKDIETFSESDFEEYKKTLQEISSMVEELYKQGNFLQINILTDRIMLDGMNNCNAGDNNLTLAPDGKFYICPAFYYSGEEAVGDLQTGIDVKNPQLYKLEYAPLCRECDSYHCKRCVWLNKKTTLEVNTPSHEQCVVSHLERNASREFLLRTKIFDREIKEIDYLDPFDVRKQW